MPDSIHSFIQKTLLSAGQTALEQFGRLQEVKQKSSQTDLVTKTDLDIHDFVEEALQQSFPDEPLISEEDIKNHNLTKPDTIPDHTYWILDPIDGTNNFAACIPLFGIMIARAKGKKLTHSGIYLPIEKNLYLAERKKGATKNGQKISCSKMKTWEQTFGCTSASSSPEKHVMREALHTAMHEKSFSLNAFGSAAISGSYVAEGRRDWYFSMGSHLWDYAPIVLLLQEAGCKVTDLQGNNWSPGMRELLAAPPKLHDSLRILL